MEFAFTPEQEELRREARSFLARSRAVGQLELGWVGVSIPEEHGGLGLGFLEEAVLLEETARALMPGPWFATTVLAQPLLDAEQLARVAAGEEKWSAEVDGLVPNLDEVDFVVTADGAVPATGGVGADDGRDEAARAPRRRQRAGRPPAAERRLRARGGRRRDARARARGRARAHAGAVRPSGRRLPGRLARARDDLRGARDGALGGASGPPGAWPRATRRRRSRQPRRRRRRPRRRSPPASARSRCTAASASPGSTSCTGSTSGPSGSRPSAAGPPRTGPRSPPRSSTA